jgi:protein SCO1/2
MKSRQSIWLMVMLVFIIPAVAYTAVNWYDKKFGSLPYFGPAVKTAEGKEQHRIREFSLVNQDNKNITLSGLGNNIIIADFFFTHCPVICPKMTNGLRTVQQAFKDDHKIIITSFSVDPERDSAAQLKKYSRKMKIDNSNWHLLTGEKKAIYNMARRDFMIVATDGDGGEDDFIHSEKLILIDKEKHIRGYYDGTDETAIKQLIQDIKKLKHEN